MTRDELKKKLIKKLEKSFDHCCKYGCDNSCGKSLHGYCDFELNHGFDLGEIFPIVTQFFSSAIDQAYSQGVQEGWDQASDGIPDVN